MAWDEIKFRVSADMDFGNAAAQVAAIKDGILGLKETMTDMPNVSKLLDNSLEKTVTVADSLSEKLERLRKGDYKNEEEKAALEKSITNDIAEVNTMRSLQSGQGDFSVSLARSWFGGLPKAVQHELDIVAPKVANIIRTRMSTLSTGNGFKGQTQVDIAKEALRDTEIRAIRDQLKSDGAQQQFDSLIRDLIPHVAPAHRLNAYQIRRYGSTIASDKVALDKGDIIDLFPDSYKEAYRNKGFTPRQFSEEQGRQVLGTDAIRKLNQMIGSRPIMAKAAIAAGIASRDDRGILQVNDEISRNEWENFRGSMYDELVTRVAGYGKGKMDVYSIKQKEKEKLADRLMSSTSGGTMAAMHEFEKFEKPETWTAPTGSTHKTKHLQENRRATDQYVVTKFSPFLTKPNGEEVKPKQVMISESQNTRILSQTDPSRKWKNNDDVSDTVSLISLAGYNPENKEHQQALYDLYKNGKIIGGKRYIAQSTHGKGDDQVVRMIEESAFNRVNEQEAEFARQLGLRGTYWGGFADEEIARKIALTRAGKAGGMTAEDWGKYLEMLNKAWTPSADLSANLKDARVAVVDYHKKGDGAAYASSSVIPYSAQIRALLGGKGSIFTFGGKNFGEYGQRAGITDEQGRIMAEGLNGQQYDIAGAQIILPKDVIKNLGAFIDKNGEFLPNEEINRIAGGLLTRYGVGMMANYSNEDIDSNHLGTQMASFISFLPEVRKRQTEMALKRMQALDTEAGQLKYIFGDKTDWLSSKVNPEFGGNSQLLRTQTAMRRVDSAKLAIMQNLIGGQYQDFGEESGIANMRLQPTPLASYLMSHGGVDENGIVAKPVLEKARYFLQKHDEAQMSLRDAQSNLVYPDYKPREYTDKEISNMIVPDEKTVLDFRHPQEKLLTIIRSPTGYGNMVAAHNVAEEALPIYQGFAAEEGKEFNREYPGIIVSEKQLDILQSADFDADQGKVIFDKALRESVDESLKTQKFAKATIEEEAIKYTPEELADPAMQKMLRSNRAVTMNLGMGTGSAGIRIMQLDLAKDINKAYIAQAQRLAAYYDNRTVFDKKAIDMQLDKVGAWNALALGKEYTKFSDNAADLFSFEDDLMDEKTGKPDESQKNNVFMASNGKVVNLRRLRQMGVDNINLPSIFMANHMMGLSEANNLYRSGMVDTSNMDAIAEAMGHIGYGDAEGPGGAARRKLMDTMRGLLPEFGTGARTMITPPEARAITEMIANAKAEMELTADQYKNEQGTYTFGEITYANKNALNAARKKLYGISTAENAFNLFGVTEDRLRMMFGDSYSDYFQNINPSTIELLPEDKAQITLVQKEQANKQRIEEAQRKVAEEQKQQAQQPVMVQQPSQQRTKKELASRKSVLTKKINALEKILGITDTQAVDELLGVIPANIDELIAREEQAIKDNLPTKNETRLGDLKNLKALKEERASLNTPGGGPGGPGGNPPNEPPKTPAQQELEAALKEQENIQKEKAANQHAIDMRARYQAAISEATEYSDELWKYAKGKENKIKDDRTAAEKYWGRSFGQSKNKTDALEALKQEIESDTNLDKEAAEQMKTGLTAAQQEITDNMQNDFVNKAILDAKTISEDITKELQKEQNAPSRQKQKIDSFTEQITNAQSFSDFMTQQLDKGRVAEKYQQLYKDSIEETQKYIQSAQEAKSKLIDEYIKENDSAAGERMESLEMKLGYTNKKSISSKEKAVQKDIQEEKDRLQKQLDENLLSRSVYDENIAKLNQYSNESLDRLISQDQIALGMRRKTKQERQDEWLSPRLDVLKAQRLSEARKAKTAWENGTGSIHDYFHADAYAKGLVDDPLEKKLRQQAAAIIEDEDNMQLLLQQRQLNNMQYQREAAHDQRMYSLNKQYRGMVLPQRNSAILRAIVQQREIRHGYQKQYDENIHQRNEAQKIQAAQVFGFESKYQVKYADYQRMNQEQKDALGPQAEKSAQQIAQTAEQIKNYNQAAQDAAEGSEKFNGTMPALAAGLNKVDSFLGNIVKRFGRQLFYSAINEVKRFAKEFNAAMTSIQVVTLKTDEQMKTVADNIMNSAKELKVSISDVAKVYEILARQGLSDEEIEERQPLINKFSKITGIDAETAAKVVTIATNTGLATPQQITDAIANVGDNAATNAKEIIKGYEKAGAAAKADGTTYAELIAMLTSITSTTQIGGNVAGRTLNTIFGRMNKIGSNELIYDENGNAVSGSAISKLLQRQGINTYQNGQKRSTFDVLYDLSQKWEGMSDAEQQQVANAIAGTRQYSNFSAIMMGMSEGETERFKQLAENSEGTVDEKDEIRMKSLQAAIDDVKNSWNEMIVEMQKNGALKAIVESTGGLIKNLGSILGFLARTKTLLPAILATVLAIKGAKLGMAITTSLIPALIKLSVTMATGLTAAAPWLAAIGALAGLLVGAGVGAALQNDSATSEIETETPKTYNEIKEEIEKRNPSRKTDIDRAKTLFEKRSTRTKDEEIEYKRLIASFVKDLGYNTEIKDASGSITTLADSIGYLSDIAKKSSDEVDNFAESILNEEENKEQARRITNFTEGLPSLSQEASKTFEKNQKKYYFSTYDEEGNFNPHYKTFIKEENGDLVSAISGGTDWIVPVASEFGPTRNTRVTSEFAQSLVQLANSNYNEFAGFVSILDSWASATGRSRYINSRIGTDENGWSLGRAIYEAKKRLGDNTEIDTETMERVPSTLLEYISSSINDYLLNLQMMQMSGNTQYSQLDMITDKIMPEIKEMFPNLDELEYDALARGLNFELKGTSDSDIKTSIADSLGLKSHNLETILGNVQRLIDIGNNKNITDAYALPGADTDLYFIDNEYKSRYQAQTEFNKEIAKKTADIWRSKVADISSDATGEDLYLIEKAPFKEMFPDAKIDELKEASENMEKFVISYIERGGKLVGEAATFVEQRNAELAKNLVTNTFVSMAQEKYNAGYAEKNKQAIASDYILSVARANNFTGFNDLIEASRNDAVLQSALLSVLDNETIQNIVHGIEYDTETGKHIDNGNGLSSYLQALMKISSTYKPYISTMEQGEIASELYNMTAGTDFFLSQNEKDQAIESAQRKEARSLDTIATKIKNRESLTDEEIDILNKYFPDTTDFTEATVRAKAAEVRNMTSENFIELTQNEDLTKGALNERQVEAMQAVLSADLYNKWQNGRLTAEEDIRLAQTQVNNAVAGISKITDRQTLAEIENMQRYIQDNGSLAGYNKTTAQTWLSGFSRAPEYIDLMQKTSLTEDEKEQLKTLQTLFDNYVENLKISIDVEGIKSLEEAGELLAGTSELVEKLKKGGSFKIDAEISIRSSAYSNRQLYNMLNFGTADEIKEATMQLTNATETEYTNNQTALFAEAQKKMNSVMAQENASLLKERNALQTEEDKLNFDATTAYGKKYISSDTPFALNENEYIRDGFIYDSNTQKVLPKRSAAYQKAKGFYVLDESKNVVEVANASVGRKKEYTNLEIAQERQNIVSGKVTFATATDKNLYNAAFNSMSEEEKRYVNKEENYEQYEELARQKAELAVTEAKISYKVEGIDQLENLGRVAKGTRALLESLQASGTVKIQAEMEFISSYKQVQQTNAMIENGEYAESINALANSIGWTPDEVMADPTAARAEWQKQYKAATNETIAALEKTYEENPAVAEYLAKRLGFTKIGNTDSGISFAANPNIAIDRENLVLNTKQQFSAEETSANQLAILNGTLTNKVGSYGAYSAAYQGLGTESLKYLWMKQKGASKEELDAQLELAKAEIENARFDAAKEEEKKRLYNSRLSSPSAAAAYSSYEFEEANKIKRAAQNAYDNYNNTRYQYDTFENWLKSTAGEEFVASQEYAQYADTYLREGVSETEKLRGLADLTMYSSGAGRVTKSQTVQNAIAALSSEEVSKLNSQYIKSVFGDEVFAEWSANSGNLAYTKELQLAAQKYSTGNGLTAAQRLARMSEVEGLAGTALTNYLANEENKNYIEEVMSGFSGWQEYVQLREAQGVNESLFAELGGEERLKVLNKQLELFKKNAQIEFEIEGIKTLEEAGELLEGTASLIEKIKKGGTLKIEAEFEIESMFNTNQQQRAMLANGTREEQVQTIASITKRSTAYVRSHFTETQNEAQEYLNARAAQEAADLDLLYQEDPARAARMAQRYGYKMEETEEDNTINLFGIDITNPFVPKKKVAHFTTNENAAQNVDRENTFDRTRTYTDAEKLKFRQEIYNGTLSYDTVGRREEYEAGVQAMGVYEQRYQEMLAAPRGTYSQAEIIEAKYLAERENALSEEEIQKQDELDRLKLNSNTNIYAARKYAQKQNEINNEKANVAQEAYELISGGTNIDRLSQLSTIANWDKLISDTQFEEQFTNRFFDAQGNLLSTANTDDMLATLAKFTKDYTNYQQTSSQKLSTASSALSKYQKGGTLNDDERSALSSILPADISAKISQGAKLTTDELALAYKAMENFRKNNEIEIAVQGIQQLEEAGDLLEGTTEYIKQLKKGGRFEIEAIVKLTTEFAQKGQLDAQLRSSNTATRAAAVMQVTGATEEQYYQNQAYWDARAEYIRASERPAAAESLLADRNKIINATDRDYFDKYVAGAAGYKWIAGRKAGAGEEVDQFGNIRDIKTGEIIGSEIGRYEFDETLLKEQAEGLNFSKTFTNTQLAGYARQAFNSGLGWNDYVTANITDVETRNALKNYAPDLYTYMNMDENQRASTEGQNLLRKITLQFETEGIKQLEEAGELLEGTYQMVEQLRKGGTFEIEARIKLSSDLYQQAQLDAMLNSGNEELIDKAAQQITGVTGQRYYDNKEYWIAEAQSSREITRNKTKESLIRDFENATDKEAFIKGLEGTGWSYSGFVRDGFGLRPDFKYNEEDYVFENPYVGKQKAYTQADLARMRAQIMAGTLTEGDIGYETALTSGGARWAEYQRLVANKVTGPELEAARIAMEQEEAIAMREALEQEALDEAKLNANGVGSAFGYAQLRRRTGNKAGFAANEIYQQLTAGSISTVEELTEVVNKGDVQNWKDLMESSEDVRKALDDMGVSVKTDGTLDFSGIKNAGYDAATALDVLTQAVANASEAYNKQKEVLSTGETYGRATEYLAGTGDEEQGFEAFSQITGNSRLAQYVRNAWVKREKEQDYFNGLNQTEKEAYIRNHNGISPFATFTPLEGLTDYEQAYASTIYENMANGISGLTDIQQYEGLQDILSLISTGGLTNAYNEDRIGAFNAYTSGMTGANKYLAASMALEKEGLTMADLSTLKEGTDEYARAEAAIKGIYGSMEDARYAQTQWDAELQSKGISLTNKYGDATGNVVDYVNKLSKGAKSAVPAIGSMISAMNKLGYQNKQLQGLTGKAGSQLSSEQLDVVSGITGIDKEVLKTYGADMMSSIVDGAKSAIDQQWADEIAAPMVEQINTALQGEHKIELARDIQLSTQANGQIDVKQLAQLVKAYDENLYAILMQYDGTGATLFTDLIQDEDGVGYILNLLRSGAGTTGKKAGGGGGGKSAVDKLLEAQKRKVTAAEHDIKMLETEEKQYDYLNDYTGWAKNIDDQIAAQLNLKKVYTDNIAEMEEQLKKVKEGSDDWYKLKEAIYSAQEAYEGITNTINELNTKKDITLFEQQIQERDKPEAQSRTMLQKLAARAMSENRFADYLALSQRDIAELNKQREKNNEELYGYTDENGNEVQGWLARLENEIEGSDAWIAIRDKIWAIEAENAELENESIQKTLELNEQRLSQIAKVLEYDTGADTHNKNIASTYSNYYQTAGHRSAYEDMIKVQLASNENILEETRKAEAAAREQMATLEEGSTAWYAARAAVYQYQEAIAQTNVTQLELNRSLAESNLASVSEKFTDATREVAHVNEMLSARAQEYLTTNDYKAYEQAMTSYIGNLASELDAQNEALGSLKQQYYVGMAMGTLDPEMQRQYLDQINERESAINSLQIEQASKQRELNKTMLDAMFEEQSRGAGNYNHNLQLLQYQASKYQNAKELTNYGKALEQENKLRKDRVAVLREELAQLEEQHKNFQDGSDDEERIVEEIKKHEEAINSENLQIEKNNELLKQNQQKIREVQKTLEDAVDKEIEAEKKRQREILSANVSMQDTILNLLKKRLQDEWDLKKKDIEKEKESLNAYKKLINDRFNYRKKASQQADKDEELADYRRQLALIEADPSRTKDAKELRRKIEELEKDKAWTIAEGELEDETSRIDENIKTMDDYISYQEEKLNELLSDANNFAAELGDILSGSFEESYDKIIAFMEQENEAFTKSLPDAQKQMIQSWEDTWKKAKDILDSNYVQITAILQDKDTYMDYIKSVNQDYRKAREDQNENEMKRLETIYEEYWDNNIAARKNDATFETHEHDLSDVESKIDELKDNVFQVNVVKIVDNAPGAEGFDENGVKFADKSNGEGYTRNDYEGIGKVAEEPQAETKIESTKKESSSGKKATTEEEKKYYYIHGTNPQGEKTTFGTHYDSQAEAEAAMKKARQNGWTDLDIDTYIKEIQNVTQSETKKIQETAKTSSNEFINALSELTENIKKQFIGVTINKDDISQFATGGLVDYTGLAWVDGTKVKPESFLDSVDTALLREQLDMYSYVRSMPYMSNVDTSQYVNNTTVGDVNITINQAELKSDADIASLAKRVGQAFTKELKINGIGTAGYSFA